MNLLKGKFFEISEILFKSLSAGEVLSLALQGEESFFLRFNNSKVRQIGEVRDSQLHAALYSEGRMSQASTTSASLEEPDISKYLTLLDRMRGQLSGSPTDQLTDPPSSSEISEQERSGKFPAEESSDILSPLRGMDATGIYAAGPVIRAVAVSSGAKHWFIDRSFICDLTLTGKQERMIKVNYSGRSWARERFEELIQDAGSHLEVLEKEERILAPGDYTVYLGPRAVADLIRMIGSAVGEGTLRRTPSYFAEMREKDLRLSNQFTLREEFNAIGAPRFNSRGETAPAKLSIIEAGRWKNSLVSARSAKEYGLSGNGVAEIECMRAPSVEAGDLTTESALHRIDQGIYIPDLHYLNWSDPLAGRITGMTRFGAAWIEGGKLKAPIRNMRFDDTVSRIFGSELLGFSSESTFEGNVIAYENRVPGGAITPGALISSFRLTL